MALPPRLQQIFEKQAITKNIGKRTTRFEINHGCNIRANKDIFGTHHTVVAEHMSSFDFVNKTIATKNLINYVVYKNICISMEYCALSCRSDKEIWIRSFTNDLG